MHASATDTKTRALFAHYGNRTVAACLGLLLGVPRRTQVAWVFLPLHCASSLYSRKRRAVLGDSSSTVIGTMSAQNNDS